MKKKNVTKYSRKYENMYQVFYKSGFYSYLQKYNIKKIALLLFINSLNQSVLDSLGAQSQLN